jgi:hypothetical protein
MIWLLLNKHHRKDRDEVSEILVRAATETDARAAAAGFAGDEKPYVWLDSDKSKCTPVDPDGPEEVLAVNRKDF